MRLVYKQLETAIKYKNVILFKAVLENKKITTNIILKVFKKHHNCLNFNILKTLLVHDKYNKDIFTSYKKVKEKILSHQQKINEISKSKRPFIYYDDIYFHSHYNPLVSNFYLKLMDIIGKNKKLSDNLISFVNNNKYYIQYDELTLILYKHNNISSCLDCYEKINNQYIYPLKYNKEKLDIFKKIKEMSIQKNKVDNF